VDQLYLRLIAECPDKDTLLQLESVVLQKLDPWNARHSQATTPYWKFPGHYELSYSFGAGTGPGYLALMAQEPAGWDLQAPEPDVSVVWNRGQKGSFLHPAVIWAELGFL
jgi:hypothetical protein